MFFVSYSIKGQISLAHGDQGKLGRSEKIGNHGHPSIHSARVKWIIDSLIDALNLFLLIPFKHVTRKDVIKLKHAHTDANTLQNLLCEFSETKLKEVTACNISPIKSLLPFAPGKKGTKVSPQLFKA